MADNMDDLCEKNGSGKWSMIIAGAGARSTFLTATATSRFAVDRDAQTATTF